MNLSESPLFVELLKKLTSEATRATTDAKASVESSPIKDILSSFEKADLSKIDFSKLLGSLLGGGSQDSGLGGILGTIGTLAKTFGVGTTAEETKAACATALTEVSDAGKKLASLDLSALAPERSHLVELLGKVIDFVKTQA